MLIRKAKLLAASLRKARQLHAVEAWSQERLATLQAARLAELAVRVGKSSAFYRKHWGGVPGANAVLTDLKPVSRAAIMDAFDTSVTDPRLTRAVVDAHLREMTGDPLLFDTYRVMASSGSTGQPACFIYDMHAWTTFLASLMRWTRWMGVTPRWPRLRTAAIGAPDSKHMTFRGAASMDVGIFNSLRLSATQPLEALVAELNRHRPDALNAYPSIAELLAEEQLAGRLRIQPKVICTSSEQRASETTARIQRAFGVTPFDCYALTETGIAAVDCAHHTGLHLFEDLCIIEIVDDNYRPVLPGTVGTRALVTNLYNAALPMIRVEISDLLVEMPGPCACGLPFRRLAAVEGRADDVLRLRARDGELVQVHPIHLRSKIAANPQVVQYRATFFPNGVTVEAIPVDEANLMQVEADLVAVVTRFFTEQNLSPLPITIAIVDAMSRESTAKLKVVRQIQ